MDVILSCTLCLVIYPSLWLLSPLPLVIVPMCHHWSPPHVIIPHHCWFVIEHPQSTLQAGARNCGGRCWLASLSCHHCLAILQWYLFPPHEQLLMAVGISMNILYILNKKISLSVDKTKKKRRKNMPGTQMMWTSFGPFLCACFPHSPSLTPSLSSPLLHTVSTLRAVAHGSGGLVGCCNVVAVTVSW